MRRKIIGVAAIALGIFVAAYFASPFLAAHSFVEAATTRDEDRLSMLVDFPAVRADMKSKMRQEMGDQLGAMPEAAEPGMAETVDGISGGFADSMADLATRPGMMGELLGSPKVGPAAKDMEFNYEFIGLDHFRMKAKKKADKEPTAFLFERRGLFAWKLVRIGLPEDMFKPTK